MDDLGERVFEIHFYECWDECLYLSENELNEWFEEIRELINDDSKSVWLRMQKLVASITNE